MPKGIALVLEEFRHNFGISDAIDIFFVSVFLYSALVWVKQTASRQVLLGVSVLAMIYFLARVFDLYLTSLAFHTTFAVLLFILVVVFQEDLRRMFARLSGWGSLRQLRPTPTFAMEADALVEATFTMAASKTGALMVVQGREPLARHVSSGIPLRGNISQQLLVSIFDARTPGHDGAVIVAEDRIEQFAAHLPISKNRQEIAGRGMRHSAALGISELSDAMTIVVSEERGTVSVSESGRLQEVASAADLKNRLEQFLATRFPQVSPAPWRRLLAQHGHLKILSIVLAIVAWLVLAYDPDTIQRTFVVSIEYRNLPEHLVLDERAEDEARVTLSGSEQHFRFLEPGTLKVSVDLSGAHPGWQEFDIAQDIHVPANLEIYRINPQILRLYLREQTLPQSAAPAGQPG